MSKEQIEAIIMLETIEENLNQLKEFAYNKDYENKKNIETLEREMFDLYYSIEDYMDIKTKLDNTKELAEIPYYYNNHHSFSKSINSLQNEKNKFDVMNKLYDFLINNLDKNICNIRKTQLDRSEMNNYPTITINVGYPKRKYTSTACIYINVWEDIIKCSQSDQPMMQKLKCWDYRPKEYIEFYNKCIANRKEYSSNESDYKNILEFCNNSLAEAREILKDVD